MISKDELIDILYSNDYDPIEFLNKNFNKYASQFLEILMKSLIESDEVEIGIYSDLGNKGALVSFDIYNIEMKLLLKLNAKFILSLEINIHDWDGNLHHYSKELNQSELELIPIGLVSIMKQVLNSNESTVVSRNSIELKFLNSN